MLGKKLHIENPGRPSWNNTVLQYFVTCITWRIFCNVLLFIKLSINVLCGMKCLLYNYVSANLIRVRRGNTHFGKHPSK